VDRGSGWAETAIADLRFSVRTLCKNPAFAVAAMGTLALGIGASTAIFSMLNAVFLRPLPYVHPERLAWATEYFPQFKRDQMPVPEYAAWRRENTAFEHLEAYGIGAGVNVTRADRAADRVRAGHVTPGFFAMLGVPAQLGRTFAPEEDRTEYNHVAVLSDGLWRNYFDADPKILGKLVTLNGAAFTVVGVVFIEPPPASLGSAKVLLERAGSGSGREQRCHAVDRNCRLSIGSRRCGNLFPRGGSLFN
jgi:putative ABC transport system permease protein